MMSVAAFCVATPKCKTDSCSELTIQDLHAQRAFCKKHATRAMLGCFGGSKLEVCREQAQPCRRSAEC